MAISFTFMDKEKTLTDKEIDGMMRPDNENGRGGIECGNQKMMAVDHQPYGRHNWYISCKIGNDQRSTALKRVHGIKPVCIC